MVSIGFGNTDTIQVTELPKQKKTLKKKPGDRNDDVEGLPSRLSSTPPSWKKKKKW